MNTTSIHAVLIRYLRLKAQVAHIKSHTGYTPIELVAEMLAEKNKFERLSAQLTQEYREQIEGTK